MLYKIGFKQPHLHYINITLIVDASEYDTIRFQLPAWRPGRYELANFAKNIQKWAPYDGNGKLLKFKKITKDLWQVECKKTKTIEVRYNYFANELNAGSSYVDDQQLYINPVNCLIYSTEHFNSKCQLELDIPKSYRIASSLAEVNKGVLSAMNYDELADSPLIASPSLKHHQYKVSKTKFHLWFQGEFKADWKDLIDKFKAFTAEQINLFGKFPVDEYHFLFQIKTKPTYHGVEHSKSTVIALGPSYSLMKNKDRFEDLLGVSSHELFHTWNVKRIRPIEMWPYDFSKENYTRMGYLTEGATTWYGDMMLYRSGVFNEEAYFKTFNQLLNRHFNNPGVRNLSVADSSFDTWLDGYEMGVPNRKSSIYTEGALITFLIDIEIRKSTKNKRSFDDVMKELYEEYYMKNKGVREEDYKHVVEKVANKDLSFLFRNYVNGVNDFWKIIIGSLDYIGLEVVKKPGQKEHESYFGVRMKENRIFSIFPDSPAEKAGFSVGDRILSINDIEIEDNLSEWLNYFRSEKLKVGLIRSGGDYRELTLSYNHNKVYYSDYELKKQNKPSSAQKSAFRSWSTTKTT